MLTKNAFDDIHSKHRALSCYTGADLLAQVSQIAAGAANRQFDAVRAVYKEARTLAFPDGVPGYQEIGNTAYITFDSFIAPRNADYYTNPPTDDKS